jgi:hypothetical protein
MEGRVKCLSVIKWSPQGRPRWFFLKENRSTIVRQNPTSSSIQDISTQRKERKAGQLLASIVRLNQYCAPRPAGTPSFPKRKLQQQPFCRDERCIATTPSSTSLKC